MEITRRDHSIIACSHHAYIFLFFAHIPLVVIHTINATPPERLQQLQLVEQHNERFRFDVHICFSWTASCVMLTNLISVNFVWKVYRFNRRIFVWWCAGFRRNFYKSRDCIWQEQLYRPGRCFGKSEGSTCIMCPKSANTSCWKMFAFHFEALSVGRLGKNVISKMIIAMNSNGSLRGPQWKIWWSPERMPVCFPSTLRRTSNNDFHFHKLVNRDLHRLCVHSFWYYQWCMHIIVFIPIKT